MNTKFILAHYWPYWTLGLCMMVATLRSDYRDLMVFKKESFLTFLRGLLIVTFFRCLMMFFNPPTLASAAPVLQIPLWLTLMTWWEDPVHTLCLAVVSRFLGESKVAKVIQWGLTGMVMVSFGLAHRYQGTFAACMLSLYIPIVTNLGKKHGFSTIIACHAIYDFLTILTVRLFVGF